MKYIKLTTILLTLLFFACNQKTNKAEPETKTEQSQTSLTNDTAELEKLTKELYKWNETKNSNVDFPPLQMGQTDTIYTGLDLKRHNQRLKELKETNFFTDQFLENYNKIALTIDEKMKNNTLEWYIDELPPFGNDTNPWCNCQDNPDKYFEKIKLKNVIINDNIATYNWTLGNNFEYKIKAKKENNNWRILYLQGFDFNEFIPTK